ncbi:MULTISPECIES: GtrA family protein [Pseudomonadota]|uniref:Putative membrane protein n=2 Tax=Rhodanobacter denitrificans TaxID=666685 RepID=M4NGE6_9GAMM|nr:MULTISPECIES: GtrA family protein [Pseudomonadota]AGG89167.1 putative membrane protein [Rhodanobacter denitrificans]TAN24940.1 MAG: GtrA family protein [Castellaniella sp.]UJJ56822.1 GtrA family protein [Rhodanobacter thiooxydans]
MFLRSITLNDGVRRTFFFLLAGGTGFLLYFCISMVLHYGFRVGEVVSAIFGTLLPIPPTFWMQRRLTFQSDTPKRQALPRYAVLQLGNAAVVSGLTALGTKMGLSGGLIFLIAGVTGALISYVVQSKLVFHEN